MQLASFLQLETETNQAQQEGHTEKRMKIKLPTLSELSEEYDLLLSQKKQAGEQLSHLNDELRISGTSNRIWIPFLMMNDLKKDRPSGCGMPSLNTNNTLPEKTDKTTPYDYERRLA